MSTLDAEANKLINTQWVNKFGLTTGNDEVIGLTFNELHGLLVQFAKVVLVRLK